MEFDQSKSQTSADEDDDASPAATIHSTKRPLEKPNKTGTSRRLKTEKVTAEMKMLKSLVDVVTQPETNVESSNSDEDVIFGQFIVSEMKKITDAKAKLLLKQTITNAVFQARIGPLEPYPFTQNYGMPPTSFGQHSPLVPPQYTMLQNLPQQHMNTPATWQLGQQSQPYNQTSCVPTQSTWQCGQQPQGETVWAPAHSRETDVNVQAQSEDRRSEHTYPVSKSDSVMGSSMLRLLDDPENY